VRLVPSRRFADGRIVSDRFSRYRVPRFSDVPPMEVLFLDRRDQPSAGAGETPMFALAPAIAGAVFNATGVRLRSLPLLPGGVLPHTR
jgi:nicotinate dehydrogenase subunit B